MIRYVCEICGTFFDEPQVIETKNSDLEINFNYREELCPICASAYFEPADYCPRCKRPKWEKNILCTACKKELLKKVSAFFDELTPDEQKQYEKWAEEENISRFLVHK